MNEPNGGAIYNYQCELTIVNSTFSNNNATGLANAGAIYIWQSQCSITNCTFSGNVANRGGGAMYMRSFFPIITVTFCDVEGGIWEQETLMLILNLLTP